MYESVFGPQENKDKNAKEERNKTKLSAAVQAAEDGGSASWTCVCQAALEAFVASFEKGISMDAC